MGAPNSLLKQETSSSAPVAISRYHEQSGFGGCFIQWIKAAPMAADTLCHYAEEPRSDASVNPEVPECVHPGRRGEYALWGLRNSNWFGRGLGMISQSKHTMFSPCHVPWIPLARPRSAPPLSKRTRGGAKGRGKARPTMLTRPMTHAGEERRGRGQDEVSHVPPNFPFPSLPRSLRPFRLVSCSLGS